EQVSFALALAGHIAHGDGATEEMAVIARRDGIDNLAVAYNGFVVEHQRLGVLEAELHHPPCQSRLPGPEYGVSADEISLGRLHGKAEPGFEHIILVGDVVPEMTKRFFDAAGIQRVQAAELE